MKKRRLLIVSGVLMAVVLAVAVASAPRISGEELARLRKDFEEYGEMVAYAQHCGMDMSPTGMELKMMDAVAKRGISSRQKESLGAFFDYGFQKQAEALHGKVCSFEEREWSIQRLNRAMLALEDGRKPGKH